MKWKGNRILDKYLQTLLHMIFHLQNIQSERIIRKGIILLYYHEDMA